MTIDPQTLLVHLRIVGVMMACLVVVNVCVPLRFHWREELARLSLVNRQIFEAHTVFLVLTLASLRAPVDMRRRAARAHAAQSRDADRADDLLDAAHADAVGLLLTEALARTPVQHGDALCLFGDLGLRVGRFRSGALDDTRLTLPSGSELRLPDDVQQFRVVVERPHTGVLRGARWPPHGLPTKTEGPGQVVAVVAGRRPSRNPDVIGGNAIEHRVGHASADRERVC